MINQFIASVAITSLILPILSYENSSDTVPFYSRPLPNWVTLANPIINGNNKNTPVSALPSTHTPTVSKRTPPSVRGETIEKVKTEGKEGQQAKKGVCTSKVRQDLVQHAYDISGGDMLFLGTISSESSWDIAAVGDQGNSIGLCQFHRKYQPDNHKAYKELKTDFEKLEFCYEKYSIWKKKGVLSTRLYGSNVWRQGLAKFNISCNQ